MRRYTLQSKSTGGTPGDPLVSSGRSFLGFAQRLWSLLIITQVTDIFLFCDPFNSHFYMNSSPRQPFATLLYSYNSEWNSESPCIAKLLVNSPHCTSCFDKGDPSSNKWIFALGLLLLQAFFALSYYCPWQSSCPAL
ncbi:hypothetical protein TYRP_002997 [Tyrophagus putrescentiae]|nr:hypothetical protein TYRP_002997 [Tyrophagus putrescentiae]